MRAWKCWWLINGGGKSCNVELGGVELGGVELGGIATLQKNRMTLIYTAYKSTYIFKLFGKYMKYITLHQHPVRLAHVFPSLR